MEESFSKTMSSFKNKVFTVIFHSDTRAGKWFDIALILSILTSVLVVMLDSVQSLSIKYDKPFHIIEWFFTILFTIEYLLRLYCTPQPKRYARSFFGLVDLVSILPSYLALFIPGGQYLLIVRSLRILRIFRILKLTQYVGEAHLLMRSVISARYKVLVFLFFILTVVSIFGSFMYLVEGPEHGFTSIPTSVYWAIVTVTTVGYGDIAPQTPLGQAIASLMVIIGYSIIAIPTGIFTAELSKQIKHDFKSTGPECQACGHANKEPQAVYCSECGAKLEHHIKQKLNDHDHR